MKHLKQLWLVSVFLLLLIGCAGKSRTDLPKQWEFSHPQDNEHFNGNVKSYTEKWLTVSETGEVEETPSMSREVLFDKNNNLIEEIIHRMHDDYPQRTIFEYNENGDMTKIELFSEGRLYALTTYELDEEGYTLSRTLEYPSYDSNTEVEQFTYDFENREVKSIDAYGYHILKFNEDGLIESRTSFSEENGQENQELYEYNEKGQTVKIRSEGQVEGEIIYTYNEQGYVARVDYDYYFEYYDYKFDKRGNWIEKKIYGGGELMPESQLMSVYVREYEYF